MYRFQKTYFYLLANPCRFWTNLQSILWVFNPISIFKSVLSLSVSFPMSILTFFCCFDFFFLNALLSVTFLARLSNATSADSFRSVTSDVENPSFPINKLKLVSLSFQSALPCFLISCFLKFASPRTSSTSYSSFSCF